MRPHLGQTKKNSKLQHTDKLQSMCSDQKSIKVENDNVTHTKSSTIRKF